MNPEQELFAKVEDFMASKNWKFKLEGITVTRWVASVTQDPHYRILCSGKTRLEPLTKLGRQIDELML